MKVSNQEKINARNREQKILHLSRGQKSLSDMDTELLLEEESNQSTETNLEET